MARLAAQQERVQVRGRQLRVVVRHLLKVRHVPVLVHAVAVEPAAQVVVHATRRHLVQREHRHVQRLHRVRRARDLGPLVRGQQCVDLSRPGELGRAAKPAQPRVKAARQLLHHLAQHHPALVARQPARARALRVAVTVTGRSGHGVLLQGLLQLGHDGGALGLHLLAVGAPHGGQAAQHRGERGHHQLAALHHVRLGVVRAPVHGFQVGGEEHAHGPPAPPAHRLHVRHVHPVHVGPLLAVHLDRHVVLVEQRRGLAALEALALHHVAPVARGVAHRQEDGLVLLARLFKRFRPPRVPIHRVVLVLQQVGALLLRQPVGVHSLPRGLMTPGAHGTHHVRHAGAGCACDAYTARASSKSKGQLSACPAPVLAVPKALPHTAALDL
mmetsp:Transcript_8357/g.20802  ORF Transcript_8357/g.20802 Transcript_8357/m.20802 type:complete len:385 (+) Transcript_8357:1571-2725(+)